MIRSKKLSLTLLVLRVLLGGLFVFSSYSKLKPPDADNPFSDPIDMFAISVDAFHILPTQLIEAATFTIPWIELVCGVMLILGLWTRPSSFVLTGLIGSFMWVINNALTSGNVDLDCGCFGGSALFCPKTGLTICHFYQDGAMLAIAVVLLLLGSGRFGLEGLVTPKKAEPLPILPKGSSAPALTNVEPAKD